MQFWSLLVGFWQPSQALSGQANSCGDEEVEQSKQSRAEGRMQPWMRASVDCSIVNNLKASDSTSSRSHQTKSTNDPQNWPSTVDKSPAPPSRVSTGKRRAPLAKLVPGADWTGNIQTGERHHKPQLNARTAARSLAVPIRSPLDQDDEPSGFWVLASGPSSRAPETWQSSTPAIPQVQVICSCLAGTTCRSIRAECEARETAIQHALRDAVGGSDS